MDIGISVGLGTDDYFHDMLQLIRQNILGQRTRNQADGGIPHTHKRPSYYELLELATRKGAEVLGIDGKLGSLEPDKKADIITFNLLNPFLTPTKDPLTSVILYGTPADIDFVIVDGKILKHDGAMNNIDIRKELLAAQDRVDDIIYRFFKDYPKQKNLWNKKLHYMI
jgi:cytosine/adenosine deaminase-related metal-dependent hydrolase